MDTRDQLEAQLREVLASYRAQTMNIDELSREASQLVARILRVRTVQLLGAMEFVRTLEDINDALREEGRRATAAERTQVDGQLAKLETLLLGVSALAQDC